MLLKESAFLRDSDELFEKKKAKMNLLTPKKEKLKQFLQRKSISRSSITDREEFSMQNSLSKKHSNDLKS